jgi:hypothetical protein
MKETVGKVLLMWWKLSAFGAKYSMVEISPKR